MTVPADFLDQPSFLAQDPVSAFLSPPSFLETAAPPAPPTPKIEDDPHFGKVAIGIAAALVVLRLLMKSALASEHPQSAEEIAAAANRIYKRVFPAWLQVAVPAIAQAYKLGSTEDVSYAELEAMASDYAAELGDYVHQSSITALTEGFNAQVNANWSERLAWTRAAEAYGLDSQQMRSYVKGVMSSGADSYQVDPIPAASRSAVDRAFLARAERMGNNEAFKASQVGRNVVWLSMVATGALPQGTRKRWATAEDEKVCPICGYLDQQVVDLDARFETIGGEKFYAPGVHPNCRCELEMVMPEDFGGDIEWVQKDMPGDPYNRNSDGEFARKEERKAEKEADFSRSADFSRAADFTQDADFSADAVAEPEAVFVREAAPEREKQAEAVFSRDADATYERVEDLPFEKIKAVKRERAKPKAKQADAFYEKTMDAFAEQVAADDNSPRRYPETVILGQERDAMSTYANGDPIKAATEFKRDMVIHFDSHNNVGFLGEDRMASPAGFVHEDPLESKAFSSAMQHWWKNDGKYRRDERENLQFDVAKDVSRLDKFGQGITEDEPELWLHRHALSGESKDDLLGLVRKIQYTSSGVTHEAIQISRLAGMESNEIADEILEADEWEGKTAFENYPKQGSTPVKDALDELAHSKGIDGLKGLDWHDKYNVAIERVLDHHAPKPLPVFYVLDGFYGQKLHSDNGETLPIVEGDYRVVEVNTFSSNVLGAMSDAPGVVTGALAGVRVVNLEPLDT